MQVADGGARTAANRLRSYLAAFAENVRSPQMSHYPGLPSQPWHDSRPLKIVAQLESAYDAIRTEVDALPGSAFHSESEPISRRGGWDVAMFYELGFKNLSVCDRCPSTMEVIRSRETVRALCGAIYVSRMRPGTRIAPHRGPTNMRLRCHLPLHVPQGDCGIRVDGVERRWVEGRCLVFDDSFEHEAWNETAEDRVVLIVDIWHPELRPQEVDMLVGLQRYALRHAQSLARYWALNEQGRADSYH